MNDRRSSTRQQSQRDKLVARVAYEKDKDSKGDLLPGGDPDITGLPPGLQPVLDS